MESRRSKKARNDKLQDIEAGTRRVILRANLWTDARLGMSLWKIQASEIQGDNLRQVRSGSDASESPSRANGAYRISSPGKSHLVF